MQKNQLQKLHEAGVQIALGADWWDDNPVRKSMHLHAYNMFDNHTLLRIWTQITPQVIFSDRNIGKLSKWL